MKSTRWCKVFGVAALGLTLAGLTGCQTWVAGMTLPSGYYLEHKPQYFRPDPDFPLEKELATMQAQDALINGGGRAAEVPAGPAVVVPVAPAPIAPPIPK
ncbi:MAG: hypothetical protein ACJ8F7_00600 [Gemmataceae bacterium]